MHNMYMIWHCAYCSSLARQVLGICPHYASLDLLHLMQFKDLWPCQENATLDGISGVWCLHSRYAKANIDHILSLASNIRALSTGTQ